MNFKNVFHKVAVAAVIAGGAAAVISCKSDPQFTLSGEVEGGADKSLLLEKSDFHGRWFVVDSVRTDGAGKFTLKSEAPASPEIYRLSLDGKFIYLPVDSIEHLTINSPAAKFGTEFTVEGTPQAVNMASFEKELMKLDTSKPEAVAEFKRNVFNKYLRESQGGIIGYYVLTKIVGDKPLYDPADDADARYYAAVATSFDQFRPQDPHAGMLKQVTLQAMRRRNQASGKKRVIEAQEVKMIDLSLQDENGKTVKLSDVAGKGKPTVLIFSLMNHPDSPVLNKALADLYNSRGGNVAFYHVAFDGDYYAWREAAKNLKWTTVIDPQAQTSDALRRYNVGSLPVFFVYDAQGSLQHRAESIQELKSKI